MVVSLVPFAPSIGEAAEQTEIFAPRSYVENTTLNPHKLMTLQ